MTREEVYKLLGNLEMVARDLVICRENNITPQVNADDKDFLSVGDDVESILAFCRANNDWELMLEMCKINRAVFYSYGDGRFDWYEPIRKASRFLWRAHDLALEKIWHVSPTDIKNCTYYVNSVEGVCRHSETGELLQLPNSDLSDTPNFNSPPPQGLPKVFDTDKSKGVFEGLCALGFCKANGAIYNWVSTNALFGYFVDKASDYLDLRNDGDRINWNVFQIAFGMTNQQISTAKNAISKVKNGTANEPQGYDKISKLCK